MISKWRGALIAAAVFLLFNLAFYRTERYGYYKSQLTGLTSGKPRSNYAYVTFLVGQNPTDGDAAYFKAARLLGYQLMHQKDIKTNSSVPFIVMVTKNVAQYQRDRLTADGAIVKEVEDIPYLPWHWEQGGTHRFEDEYTKLRVFEWTRFDRILYIDSDMLLLRPLDGIFQDTDFHNVVQNTKMKRIDTINNTISWPSTYVLTMPSWPVHRSDSLNGGVFFLRPDKELFDVNMAVFGTPWAYNPSESEQSLLNYVHQPASPMPARQFERKWNTMHDHGLWPPEEEPASVHIKWRRADQMHESWVELIAEMEMFMTCMTN